MADSKSLLSVSDICAIIKACGENGVRKLTYGGLSLRLGGQTAPVLDNSVPGPRPEPASIPAIEELQEKEAERAFVDDETQLKEDQLRLMLIEDPEGLEKLINQMQQQGDELKDEPSGPEEET